jgi:hypothetical protein
LDGRLRVLGLRDGNGLEAMIVPGRVKSVAEAGAENRTGRKKSLEFRRRNRPGAFNLAAVVLEGEQSLRASERPFRGVGF